MDEPSANLTSSTAAAAAPAAAAQDQGFFAVPLRYVPASAFRGLPVFLRNDEADGTARAADLFTLYRTADVPFTPEERRRLLGSVRHVYLRSSDQLRFQQQSAQALVEQIKDPNQTTQQKATLVYDAALNATHELLEDPDVNAHTLRLQGVARGVATLVLSDAQAYQYLLAVSGHDLYTATHMTNVGTWIVALAYAMGHRDLDELVAICQAGLLHDLGKLFVPAEVLNKPGRLTREEWDLIRRHPVLGWEHVRDCEALPTLVKDVCRQHHERLDGTGYPDRLKMEYIHPVSRMCAIIDSFDAMTSIRPFRDTAKSVSEAILELKAGTPTKYDAGAVEAWVRLLGCVEDRLLIADTATSEALSRLGMRDRRRYKRFNCDCVASVHVLRPDDNGAWQQAAGFKARVRDLSRNSLGLISGAALQPGDRVRILIQRSSAEGTAKRVEGRVTRCSSLDDGQHEIGVELFPAGATGEPDPRDPVQ